MSRKRTGSSRYFVIFLFAICLLIGIYLGIKNLMSRVNWFHIKDISIEGNENLEKQFLSNLSLDFVGSNLYAISKNDVKLKYENIVRIADLEIRKVFPNKIKIIIKERKGLFNIKTLEGDIFPVDKEMIVLDNDSIYPDEILPVVETQLSSNDLRFGETAEDTFLQRVYVFYRQVVPTFPDFIQNVSEFYPRENEIFIVEANIGYKIVFGEEEIIDKVRRYEFLEQNRKFEKDKIVDLRYPDQLVIRSEE